jgi:predicted HicB family RNase H-like nuclease
MPKLNKGKTIKLSIRLSASARKQIEIAAKNLGVSLAGIILFELTKLLKNPPSQTEITDLEDAITLEREHFVLTVNENLMKQINQLAEDYGIKKNRFIGYIVSNHFEHVVNTGTEKDLEAKKLMVQVNETLKKKMMEYSERHYIPLNALVSYSVLQGPSEQLPSYEGGEMITFFTNVPAYIGDLIKEKAEEENIREHFYTSLCLYKQFMAPEGRFYK